MKLWILNNWTLLIPWFVNKNIQPLVKQWAWVCLSMFNSRLIYCSFVIHACSKLFLSIFFFEFLISNVHLKSWYVVLIQNHIVILTFWMKLHKRLFKMDLEHWNFIQMCERQSLMPQLYLYKDIQWTMYLPFGSLMNSFGLDLEKMRWIC
jgi:hypothetical protein